MNFPGGSDTAQLGPSAPGRASSPGANANICASTGGNSLGKRGAGGRRGGAVRGRARALGDAALASTEATLLRAGRGWRQWRRSDAPSRTASLPPPPAAAAAIDTIYTARVHGFAAPGLVNLTGLDGHEGLLSLVAVLGSSVSLVALVFAFITYSLFSDLRTISGTALINLLAALFMVQLLFVIGVGGVQDRELCWSLALALHYMRLTVFCWLTAMTFDLYCCFRENVSLVAALPSAPALRRSFAQLSVFGWGAPLLPTLAAGLVQLRPGAAPLSDPSCWFFDDTVAAATFALPAAALLVADLAFLVRAFAMARAAANLQLEHRIKAKMNRRRRLQLWLFFRLAAFLAVVSAVGVAARLTHNGLLAAVFSVAAGLQGLVVALSVACSCRVLKLYTRPRRPPPEARPGALHKAPSAMHLLQNDASPV